MFIVIVITNPKFVISIEVKEAKIFYTLNIKEFFRRTLEILMNIERFSSLLFFLIFSSRFTN